LRLRAFAFSALNLRTLNQDFTALIAPASLGGAGVCNLLINAKYAGLKERKWQ
jgi:hypothetical protein